MLQHVRVAAAAIDAKPGEVGHNLDSIEVWAHRAAGAGASLLLLPELSLSGFLPNHPAGNHESWLREALAGARRMAEPIDGPAVQRLRSIARDTGLLIAAGLLEDGGSLLFNTHVLAGPTGVLGTWRKMHVPLFEMPLYNGGEPDRREIEEERRLCYVGMTRAMTRLYCSNARVRHRFGEYLAQVPSRFLGEIPPGLTRTLPSTMGPAPGAHARVRPARRPRPARKARADDGWYHTDPQVDLADFTSDAEELRPGIQVEHEQFGRGKIVEIEYAGKSTRALVDFRSHGRKHLVVKYARLRIV